MKYFRQRTIPHVHPAIGGALMAVFLFAFLIVFDLLVLGEALAEVWAGALTTAIAIGLFQAVLVSSARRRAAEKRSDDPGRG